MCGVMANSAQASQEKTQNPKIFAFAIKGKDFFCVYVDFFAFGGRFSFSFPRRDLASGIPQIEYDACGNLVLNLGGRIFDISPKLLKDLKIALKEANDAKSLGAAPISNSPMRANASAQVMPARQISKSTEERNFEAADDLKENYSSANSKENHLQNSSPSILAAASTHGHKSATLADAQEHRAFSALLNIQNVSSNLKKDTKSAAESFPVLSIRRGRSTLISKTTSKL